jgi:hypothetical protein
MGTRADFYVAKADQLEWLGSIAWDGYCIDHVALASTEEQFRQSLEEFFATRDDVTRPEQGWPWPWDTSDTTDYGYVFIEGHGVVYKCFGGDVRSAADESDDPQPIDGLTFTYPDMSDRKRVAGGNRSGLIVLGGAA